MIANLEKKVIFVSKELEVYKKDINIYEEEMMNKDIKIEELKNAEAGNQIMEKYEL